MKDKETQAKLIEFTKIANNPLQFLENVWISDPLRGAVKFEFWPHLVELLDGFLKNKLIIVLKTRQVGISWLAAAYSLWIAMTRPNSRIFLISLGEREAIELLAKCKYTWAHLPDNLKMGLSIDSATVLGVKAMESQIIALPSTESAGRSQGGTLLVCDEWDFHSFAEQNFAAAKPIIDAGGQMIGVSTSQGDKPDSFFKNVYRDAKAGKNNFKAYFYGWKVRPGRTEAWYEDKVREYPAWLLEKEYAATEEQALSPLTAHSFFDKDTLYALLQEVEKPIDEPGLGVYIYRKPKVGIRYVAGVDVGEGIGEDYSTLTILGREGVQSEVCAIINSNQIASDLFAYEVDKLCRQYFNCLLGVENNSLGLAVVNKLLDLRYPNLYYSDKGKKKAGITITGNNRETNLVELGENLRNGSLITRDRTQILQMIDFFWKDGKPQGGKHDDLVSSISIANQMLKQRGAIAGITVVYT